MPNAPFSLIRKYNRLITQGNIVTAARVVTDIVGTVIVDGLL
jgi:hypothetical protein